MVSSSGDFLPDQTLRDLFDLAVALAVARRTIEQPTEKRELVDMYGFGFYGSPMSHYPESEDRKFLELFANPDGSSSQRFRSLERLMLALLMVRATATKCGIDGTPAMIHLSVKDEPGWRWLSYSIYTFEAPPLSFRYTASHAGSSAISEKYLPIADPWEKHDERETDWLVEAFKLALRSIGGWQVVVANRINKEMAKTEWASCYPEDMVLKAPRDDLKSGGHEGDDAGGDDEEMEESDGPHGVFAFTYNGKTVKGIEPKPWRLLEIIFKSRDGNSAVVREETVKDALFGVGNDGSLKSATHRANKVLMQVAFPGQIHRQDNNVFLEFPVSD